MLPLPDLGKDFSGMSACMFRCLPLCAVVNDE